MFFKIGWARVLFPRAYTYGARQSILLIMEIISHTFIAIVAALKAMKINQQKIRKILKIFENFSDLNAVLSKGELPIRVEKEVFSINNTFKYKPSQLGHIYVMSSEYFKNLVNTC